MYPVFGSVTDPLLLRNYICFFIMLKILETHNVILPTLSLAKIPEPVQGTQLINDHSQVSVINTIKLDVCFGYFLWLSFAVRCSFLLCFGYIAGGRDFKTNKNIGSM